MSVVRCQLRIGDGLLGEGFARGVIGRKSVVVGGGVGEGEGVNGYDVRRKRMGDL